MHGRSRASFRTLIGAQSMFFVKKPVSLSICRVQEEHSKKKKKGKNKKERETGMGDGSAEATKAIMCLLPGRFRGSPPEHGLGQELFSKSHGSGRVGSGRVGSGRVGSGRIGSGREVFKLSEISVGFLFGPSSREVFFIRPASCPAFSAAGRAVPQPSGWVRHPASVSG